jgi:cytochrome c oxidase subunit II
VRAPRAGPNAGVGALETTLMRPSVARSRPRTILRIATPLLLVGLLAGCLFPPEPMTDAGRDVFTLYTVIFVLAAIVFVGVEGMIIYSIFRYRRRDDRLPPQLHGNTLIEIVWTAIPTVIVLILFGASVWALNSVEARADDPLTIEAEGFQWQWRFHYEEGVSVTGTPGTPARMVVPVGEPIRLILTSADVIHSWYVPEFLIKRDNIPFAEGQEPNQLEFTVTQPGTYTGQCAEFCGFGHWAMIFLVEAMERADYDAWLEEALTDDPDQPPIATPPPDAQIIELTANNNVFDTDRLEVPANEVFVIRFHNEDTGIPHDVDILGPDGETIFDGHDFPGPATVDYIVDPLEPGEYEFICSIHPLTMRGTLVASE